MIYHVVVGSCWDDNAPYGSFADLQNAVDQAVGVLDVRHEEFDVIAVQGSSGMAVGFPVALELQKRGWKGKIVVVRKPGEDSHCGPERITGGSVADLRCLFVDDFVSMGSTRTRVREAVEAGRGRLVAEYTSRENAYSTL